MSFTDEQLAALIGALPPAPGHLVERVKAIPSFAGDASPEPSHDDSSSEDELTKDDTDAGLQLESDHAEPTDDPFDGDDPGDSLL